MPLNLTYVEKNKQIKVNLWEEPTRPRLPFLTLSQLPWCTPLLSSPQPPLYFTPPALHPENKPQWELQWSSWLHCWLHSGSTDHSHSNLSCSTARFQTAEGVSCRRVLRVRRFRMQWFQTPTKKCALFTLFEGCSDVPLSSWLQAPWIQNLQQRVGTCFHEHTAWTFSFK